MGMMAASQRPPQPNRDVFVVRLWRNRTDGSWQGQIVHVDSGQTISFGSDDEVLAYIRQRLDNQEDRSSRSGLR
jgi:hypothetical protein